MFITKDDMRSAIYEHHMINIAVDDFHIQKAINAAISEATSYLNAKYDCQQIFSQQGDDRHALVLEHCKSMAVWYLLRLSNADVLYEKAKDYYLMAVDWFKQVAGVDASGRTIAPDLPLKKTDDGAVITKFRGSSNTKFTHCFDS